MYQLAAVFVAAAIALLIIVTAIRVVSKECLHDHDLLSIIFVDHNGATV